MGRSIVLSWTALVTDGVVVVGAKVASIRITDMTGQSVLLTGIVGAVLASLVPIWLAVRGARLSGRSNRHAGGLSAIALVVGVLVAVAILLTGLYIVALMTGDG